MEKESVEEIIDLAKSYSEKRIPWHHHFLTLKCRFNKSNKFQIILENEKTGKSFFAEFDYKPMKELELLENLFFKRK